MATIAIIDDDIYIGDMLAELLQKTATLCCVPTLARKRSICWNTSGRIWCSWI